MVGAILFEGLAILATFVVIGAWNRVSGQGQAGERGQDAEGDDKR